MAEGVYPMPVAVEGWYMVGPGLKWLSQLCRGRGGGGGA